MEADISKETPSTSGAAMHSMPITNEKDLRRKAMKLDLAPILGKAFRYVTVNKNGECEEVDEQVVRERRESFLRGSNNGASFKKTPLMKKLRKARRVSSAASPAVEEIDIEEGYSKPEWLPSSFFLTRATKTHISGWVSTEEELAHVLASHSEAFSCRFVAWYRGRGLSNTFDPKRIAWKREDIEPDCPFAIDSYLVRHCPHGMRLKRLAEVRDSYGAEKTCEESKEKLACSARLKIRRITIYEGFRLSQEERTKKKVMCEKMMKVKQLINQGQEMITSNRIYLQLPLPAAHTSHTVPEFGETPVESEMEGERVEEDDHMRSLFSEEQREVSLNAAAMPKIEVKEMEESSQPVEGPFELMGVPMVDADPNSEHWKVDQSFMVDGVSNVWTSEEHETKEATAKTERESGEFQFEVRPPHKRTHILASCKVDCPARVKVKRVSLYEGFRLKPGDSRRKKDDKMLMVKDMISTGAEGLDATPAIFMQLPLAAAHRNHQVSIPLEEHLHAINRGSNVVDFGNSQHLSIHDEQQQQEQYQHQQQYEHQQQQKRFGWLPQCFNMTSCSHEYITGWVGSENEYLHIMECHRHAFNCSFLCWSNDKERTFKAEADRRVMWKKDFVDPGCPLTVHHSLILACAFSDQSKGKALAASEGDLTQPDLTCLAPDTGESIIQVPPGLVQDGTSLEIQYCDASHPEFPELQSLMKPNETYIILVENS